MMKVHRALKEVWDWKEKAYRETKDFSMKSRFAYINKKAAAVCRSHRMNLCSAKRVSA